MSDEEGETFPPRKVRSQPCHQEEEATQRLKRSVFSFKIPIAQDGMVETVIHHS